jgi:hypothetical protein
MVLKECCRDCQSGPLFNPDGFALNLKCLGHIRNHFVTQRFKRRVYVWGFSVIWPCPGYRAGPDDRFHKTENIQLMKDTLRRAQLAGEKRPRKIVLIDEVQGPELQRRNWNDLPRKE